MVCFFHSEYDPISWLQKQQWFRIWHYLEELSALQTNISYFLLFHRLSVALRWPSRRKWRKKVSVQNTKNTATHRPLWRQSNMYVQSNIAEAFHLRSFWNNLVVIQRRSYCSTCLIYIAETELRFHFRFGLPTKSFTNVQNFSHCQIPIPTTWYRNGIRIGIRRC